MPAPIFIPKTLEKNYPATKLIVGSIRSPDDILKLVRAKPQVITIPTKIVKGLESSDVEALKNTNRSVNPTNVEAGNSLFHPMTSYTLDEFEKAADSYRNE